MSRLLEKTMSFRIALIGALLFALPGYLWTDTELDDLNLDTDGCDGEDYDPA
jgi:hypothetical protein